MTVMAPAIRWGVPAATVRHALNAARLAAAAAAEAVAAVTLLLGGSLHPSLVWPMAAAWHGLAAWLVATLPGARPSGRWLAAAAILAVPIAGVAIAVAAIATRGRGLAVSPRRRRAAPRSHLTAAAMRHLAGALSPCDALACGDADERRGALSALGRREDSEAIALLRRAAAGGDPDLALSAALVLDEIGERAERRVGDIVPAESRDATG